MQPYFFPYVGYFQLIAAVDAFVVYDNIEYTKRGWINRNRILRDGEPAKLSLPLKKASDFLDVRERELAVVLLTNRTWPHRNSQAIRTVRPAFHDAVMESLDRGRLA